MTIHREGKASLIITLVTLGIINGILWRYGASDTVLYISLAISLILFLIVLQFFRYPSRQVAMPNGHDVLAPADGKVVVIEDTIESEYFEDERLMISIFMSPINVHSNHHPINGEIAYSKYHSGKYLVAWHPKSSTENERHTTVYKNRNGEEVLIRQIAGALARRIVNYMKGGEKVVQGGELGFIKFGSRVDIYLPVGTQYNVKLGQTVQAKVDIIATLEESQNA